MDTRLNIEVRVIARDAASQFRMLERQVQAYEQALARASMSGKAAGSGGFFQQLGNQVNAASRAFANAETTGQRFAAVGSGIKGVWSAMTGGIGNAITKLGAFNEHLISAGKNLQWAGRQIEYRFSLPLIAAGVYAAKFAFANEAAFTQVKKVYGLAAGGASHFTGELNLLQRAFVALSDMFGVQQTDVIAIGALWAEAGDMGVALAKDVKLTLETMILAGTTYEDAAKSLITLRSAYGLTADGMRKALAVINVIQATTSATFGDLVQAISRGGSAAITAGVDLTHFAAMVTTLVPAAGSAERAGNSLKTILSRLFAPTKQSADMMKLLGINVNTTSYQALNGSQRIELLAHKFSTLSGAQQAMAASVIGTRFQFNSLATLLRDIDNPLGNYRKSLKLTGNEQKNMQIYTRELGTFLSSQPQAFNIAKTQLQNAFAQVIVPMLPAIIGVVSALAQLIRKFTELSPSTQTFILSMAALLAIAGPIISTLGATGVLFGLIGKTALGAGKGILSVFRGFGLLSKSPPKLGLERAVAEAAKTGNTAGTVFVDSTAMALEEGAATIVGAATGIWETAGTEASIAAATAGEETGSAFLGGIATAVGTESPELTAAMAGLFAAEDTALAAEAAAAGEAAGAAYLGGIAAAMSVGGVGFAVEGVADITAAAPEILAAADLLGQAAGTTFDAGVATGMAAGVPVKVAAALADFAAAAPEILTAASELGTAAGSAIDAGVAEGLAGAGSVAVGAVAAIGSGAADAALAIGPEVVGGIGEGLAAAGSEALAAGTVVGTAVIDGVESAITALGGIIPEAIDATSSLVGDAAAGVGGEAAAGVIGGLEVLPTGVTQIIGAALAGALLLVALFRTKLFDAFKNVVGAIASAISSLPGIVGDALVAVFHVVMDIGKAIWQALQDFLNPFQRHSPSLVDLVSLGVDIIARKYRGLRTIGADLRSSIADMKTFKSATKALSDDVQNADFNASLAKIAKNPKVPGASAAGGALIGNIKSLQGDLDRSSAAYARQQAVVTRWGVTLDKANVKLQHQQDILDRERTALDRVSSKLDDAKQHLDKVSSAPLKGENAATEAIYQNELATKKWQLALSSLESTYGTLDQIKQKMSDINGELELLQGSDNALRMKGAGSDVLGPLRAQEAALRAQQQNLGGVATKMTAYQTTIDNLTTAGQKMQLVFDTTFGDMHHQIDRVANAAKEISFAKAIKDTQHWKPIVDSLTTSYDNQNQKIKNQQAIVTSLTTARDGIQRSYDQENKKLTALGNLYDAINQQIQNETGLLKDLAASAQTAADATAAAFNAAAAGKFKAPKTNLKTDPGSLKKLVDEWEKNIKKSFGSLKLGDVFSGPFKAAWHKFQDWWVGSAFPFIKRIPGDVVGFLSNGDNWSTLGNALATPFKAAWHGVQNWWTATAFPWIKKLPGLIAGALGSLAGAVGRALGGVGHAILTPFKAAWKSLGGGKGSIPYQIGHMVGQFALLPIKIIGALAGLDLKMLKWLTKTFKNVIEKLPGVAAGLLDWFKNLPEHLYNSLFDIFHLAAKMVLWLGHVAGSVLSALPGIFLGIVHWYAALPGKIIDAFSGLAGGLLDVFKGAWNSVASWWNDNVASKGLHIPGFHNPIPGLPNIPDIDVSLPTLKVFALAAGGVAQAVSGGQLARVAEAGRNELIAPLPHGFSLGRMNDTLMRLERYVDNQGHSTTMAPVTNNKHITFTGDLSFPSVKDGGDAEAFIRNLESLVD